MAKKLHNSTLDALAELESAATEFALEALALDGKRIGGPQELELAEKHHTKRLIKALVQARAAIAKAKEKTK